MERVIYFCVVVREQFLFHHGGKFSSEKNTERNLGPFKIFEYKIKDELKVIK